MAIADTITSMQNHTSNAYTMIGYGTDLTGINKNLENLSTSIFNAFLEALRNPDTLFTNLPKKSGTGSNITLNDTANASMRIELGASELTQANTPTPSSPQAVHTISGSNKVVVCGKNLFDKDNATYKNYYIKNDNGVEQTSSISGYLTSYIPVKPNTQYTILGTFRGVGEAMRFYYYDNSKNWISRTSQYEGDSPYTITTPNNCYYLQFQYIVTSYDASTVQVAEGNITTYTPYISQEANIDLSSKNLFDSITWYGAMNDLSASIFYKAVVNGIEYIKYRSSSTLRTYQFMKGQFKENTQYTLTCKARKFNQTTGVSTGFQFTYTDGTNSKYWVNNTLDEYTLSATSTSGKTIDYITIPENYNEFVIVRDIMLNEGTTALPYEPYYNYGDYGKIGNYEDKFIRTSGKNMFDGEIELGGINPDTGALVSDNTRTRSKNFIKVKPNTTYSFTRQVGSNRWVVGYTSAKTGITDGNVSGKISALMNITSDLKTGTFTTSATTEYIKWYDTSCTDLTEQVMINKGSTPLPYEPYGSNEWYIKKNIGKVVLDGTENWQSASSVVAGTYRYYYDNSNVANLGTSKNTTTLSYSNKFVGTSWANIYQLDTTSQNLVASYSQDGGAGRIVIRTDQASSVADFKTWLGTNTPIVYYINATPTYTDITGTLAEQLEQVYKNMLSQKGQTNISQINNDLPFVINASAIEEV